MSSTVSNRAFLFACNELSQRYCEGEGEYSQCFGKTMALCVKVNVGAMLWRWGDVSLGAESLQSIDSK